MNLELIKRNKTIIDTHKAESIGKKLGLHKRIAELLFSRGFDTEESINRFLTPDKKNFYDPYLLKGMNKAAERIKQAIDNNETVVVYGDYDVDGICAAAILSLYLSDCGLNIIPHIPSRINDGYGLSIESLDKIIDAACPDLILTCDCGVSAVKEVEHAQDLGVDVIITDHHEIAVKIPDCIIVNPKQKDCNYPIDNLCGAGVALKVVQALGGIEAAEKYLDLAAIATIADLVPLLDENRLIVQLGLKDIKKMNKGLRALLINQQIENGITSSDIAYKIAPRINAAGRMGDAYRAFELLTTSDNQKIDTIISEINEDNIKRKALCDELYIEAVGDIRAENLVSERAIVLSHPSWEKGITGILAARIASDFRRPSFILVSSGDCYKGTSRSIGNINIYELLSSLSDILIEFGGHSQAAGFSVKKENIPAFKARANKYLQQFDEKAFLPSCEYDMELSLDEIDVRFCKELEKIEPIGNSNVRPVFLTAANNLNVSPCKNNNSHTNIVTENGLTILAFNFYNENQFLLGNSEKKLALELQLNNFGNRETTKAVLKAVKPSKLYINDETAKANYLKNLEYGINVKAEFSTYEKKDFLSLIDENIYGTLVIAACEKTYNEVSALLKSRAVISEFMFSTTKNNFTKIMVAPIFDESIMLSNYKKIIFADSPVCSGVLKYLNKETSASVYIPYDSNEKDFFAGLTCSRDIFTIYYDAVRRNQDLSAHNIFTYFKQLSSRVQNLNISQFVFCYLVFSQLKFITLQEGKFSLKINSGIKAELTDSDIFNYVKGRL